MNEVSDLASLHHDCDFVLPFTVGDTCRGRIVRLGPALNTILNQHNYPVPVARLLAELLTLTATFAASLKFEGIFTLQIKGDGPVRLAVADITSEGALRGYAQFDPAKFHDPWPEQVSLPHITGQGYLAFTVDQGDFTDRYQGIVELAGTDLTDCLHHYFRQSEQLSASIKIAIAKEEGSWRTGGLMLQLLPKPSQPKYPLWDDDDLWRRAIAMMSSARSEEMTKSDISLEDLLYRLFHEDGVRVFEGKMVRAQCRCSENRVKAILDSLTEEELQEVEVDKQIIVTCEFCNTEYRFSKDQLTKMRE